MKIVEAAPQIEVILSQFEETVSALDKLPTMPAVVQRLLSVTASPDCSLDDVEELIAADQAITVKMMRLASSAAMSTRPVTSLRAALVRIGLRNLRKLIMAALMIDAPAPGRLHKEVWGYSLRVAAICEALASRLPKLDIEDPFLCGLLHDFGIVALERVLGSGYADAFATPGDNDHLVTERSQFSFDHCDMGAILAREWNLFPTLVSVMQLHHSPIAAREVTDDASFIAVNLVALARHYSFEEEESEESAEVRKTLGISPEVAADAVAKGLATFEKVYAGLLS